MSMGALLSVYGYQTSMMLNTPRLTFALAEQGDFPRIFAAVHPRFRTPYVSIVVFALVLWLLAGHRKLPVERDLVGHRPRLLLCDCMRRGACAAPPRSRRGSLPRARRAAYPGSRRALSLLLAAGIKRESFLVLALVFLVSLLNWLWARRQPARVLD